MKNVIEPKGVQKFKLTYFSLGAEMTVKINFDKENEYGKSLYDLIKEMVEFWVSWEYRVKIKNGGCYVKTFLKQLMLAACHEGLENNLNLYGIESYFNEDEDTPEGYYPLKEIGIEITDWNNAQLDSEDISIENTEE